MTYWRTSRAISGGDGQSPGSHSANSTRAETYKLPAQSLRDVQDFDDARRSTIAGRLAVAFLSLCFLIPLICAGVILRFQ